VRADRDGAGAFLVRGSGVVTFMGETGEDAECVVGGDVEYRVGGGRWCNLAEGLGGTSYGLRAVVL